MTVLLLKPYSTFAQGATVDLDNATEASLVQQGLATYTLNPGAAFFPLTAAEQQTLRDGFPPLTSAQAAAVAAVPALVASDTSLATANANTAAINAALALGRDVYIRAPGTYTLACTTPKTSGTKTYNVALLIPSNCRLTVGAGVILKIRAGTTNPVMIQNSDVSGGNSNITIDGLGDFDGNAANVTRDDGTIFSCILVWMQNVNGLHLRDFRCVDANAWAVGIANCKVVRTKGVRFHYTTTTANQGGFQVQGPNNDHVYEETSGYTIDDAVAIVTHDYGVYASAMAGAGAANDITIRGVHADVTLGMWHHVRLLDSTTNTLTNVQVSNLTGPYNKGGPMVGGSTTGADSLLRNISFDGVQIYPTSATPQEALFTLNGSIESISISNVQRKVPSTETGKPMVSIENTAVVPTIGSLRLQGIDWRDDSTTSASLVTIDKTSGARNAGAVTNFQLDDLIGVWTGVSAGGALLAVNDATAVAGSVQISNARVKGHGRIVYNGGSITRRVKLSNVDRENSIRATVRHNNATGTFPKLELCNVSSTGTGLTNDGGEITFSTAVSGTCAVLASNVELVNGSTVVSNPGAASVSWDGACLPGVETAALTNVVGYLVRDKTGGLLKVCTTAPSTYTAIA